MDQIKQGSENAFIYKDSVTPNNGQLQLDGDLYITGNLRVNGESVSLETQTQGATTLYITGSTPEPSLVIDRIDTVNDLVNISNLNNFNIFNIIKDGKVGIGTYPLTDSGILCYINGTVFSDDFYGAGSNLYGINLNDRNTDLLDEGIKNLYYTADRVGNIASASNAIALNEIEEQSQSLKHQITTNIEDTSNYIDYTSNYLHRKLNTSIFFEHDTIKTMSEMSIVNIPERINASNTNVIFKTIDFNISTNQTLLFSAALIVTYNIDKTFQNLTYHLYFSYYTYDKITKPREDTISFDENLFRINGETLHITPRSNEYTISVITR